MKTCTRCNIEKSNDDFIKSTARCRSCRSSLKKEYYQKNKDKIIKDYYLKNKDKIKKRQAKYYQDNINKYKIYKRLNKDNIKKYMVEYRIKNKDHIKQTKKEYENNKWRTDPIFKLKKIVSNSIYDVLLSKKESISCLKFLGYSIIELFNHIEKQFKYFGNEWMNWNNQGKYDPKTWDDNNPSTWKWQLDHIVPHSKFQYTSMEDEDFKKCWALNNLRPYSAKQNIIEKNNR